MNALAPHGCCAPRIQRPAATSRRLLFWPDAAPVKPTYNAAIAHPDKVPHAV
ncbi:MAG: hypothetical protein U0324_16670 [Polyangiales bacterium]